MSQSPNDPKRSAIGAGVTPGRSPSWPTPCSLPPRTNAKSSTRSSSSRPGARPRSASGHAGERAAHPHPRRTRGPARTPALARRDAVGPQSHRHHQRRTQSAANPSSPSTSPSASPQASPPCDTSPPVAPDPSCCSPPRTLTTSCAHASRPSPAPPPRPCPTLKESRLGLGFHAWFRFFTRGSCGRMRISSPNGCHGQPPVPITLIGLVASGMKNRDEKRLSWSHVAVTIIQRSGRGAERSIPDAHNHALGMLHFLLVEQPSRHRVSIARSIAHCRDPGSRGMVST